MALNESMTTGGAIAACCASIGGVLCASAAYAGEGPAPQPLTALHCGHLIDTVAARHPYSRGVISWISNCATKWRG